MANELQAYTTTGLTVYSVLLNETGSIYNGSGFVAISSTDWTNYDIAMTEATAGIYTANMPAVAAGEYAYVVYQQASTDAPAITDTAKGNGVIDWNGTAEIDITDLATPTNITAGTITTVTNLTNLPAITTNWLTAAGIKADAVDKIIDEVIIGTYTLRQILTIVAAKLVGVADGGGTTSISYDGIDGASNVIVETVDVATGNRSAVALTV